MSEKRIERRSLADRRQGRTDWSRVDAMTEEEIEANAVTDPDNPPWTDEQLRAAELLMPTAGEAQKIPVSIRMDSDVLEFFRREGAGYQSRINAVLRAYVRTQAGRR